MAGILKVDQEGEFKAKIISLKLKRFPPPPHYQVLPESTSPSLNVSP
jgi:hypothetical protein